MPENFDENLLAISCTPERLAFLAERGLDMIGKFLAQARTQSLTPLLLLDVHECPHSLCGSAMALVLDGPFDTDADRHHLLACAARQVVARGLYPGGAILLAEAWSAPVVSGLRAENHPQRREVVCAMGVSLDHSRQAVWVTPLSRKSGHLLLDGPSEEVDAEATGAIEFFAAYVKCLGAACRTSNHPWN